MSGRTYLGGGTDRLVMVQDRSLTSGHPRLRMKIRQLVGGKRWSLALITNITATPAVSTQGAHDHV